jgi:LmbE family N-acetylglucosaminyl deacetylase
MTPDTVILSPHFDDAVLSCWHVLAGAGEVQVVNVFAGEPCAGTLGWWDRLAGASDSAAVVRERIAEDRRALALAGRAAVNLPFLDGQYRQEGEAPGEIVKALRGVLPAGARIYAPAGLGDCHPDHLAVRSAALALHGEGAEVRLYADLPHATLGGWPRWVLEDSAPAANRNGERWAAQLRSTGIAGEWTLGAARQLSADEHAEKLQAVLAYGSQLAPLRAAFGLILEDPRLLGFEVEWRLAY